jgi:hypothetical protein
VCVCVCMPTFFQNTTFDLAKYSPLESRMTPSNDSVLLRRCNRSAAGLIGVRNESNDFFLVCCEIVCG